MKFFKKILCFCILTCLGIGIGFGVAMLQKPSQLSSAIVVSEETFEYISLSTKGQALSMDNLKTVDNTTYVIANDSVTISLKPLKYSYRELTLNEDEYIISKEIVTIPYDSETENYEQSFDLFDTTYYYQIDNLNLNIYASPVSGNPLRLATSENNKAISFVKNDNVNIIVTFITKITLKTTTPNTTFSFQVNSNGILKSYNLEFMRPMIEFANGKEPIVEFICKGLDAGAEFTDYSIPVEHDYNTVQMNFLSNHYNENNKLYFKINHNGFVYDFELYSKTYDGNSYLFVNYIDATNTKNNQYLATALKASTTTTPSTPGQPAAEPELDKNHLIKELEAGLNNTFSLVFDTKGRYSIEIYDATYLLGFDNANYMQTSFYITDATKSIFDNIYIIAQTQDNDGKDIEYIVSSSTLNNNVKATIKNLDNLKDASGNPVPLDSVIETIEVTKTNFGGSSNVHVTTTYTPADIEELLQNGDFVLFFDDDAFYEINIYQKNSDIKIYYNFTIVKFAKTTFAVPLVDENGSPILDENDVQKRENYEATTPFKTEVINYKLNILSSMSVKLKFRSTGAAEQPKNLGKTFTNMYTVSYGVQSVNMERFEIKNSEDKNVPGLHLRFYGVGNIRVEVTVNGTTTLYELNSELGNNTISLENYGNYSVRMVDSMGTEMIRVYSYHKKLNTSAIALISLAAFLGVAILLFVLRARGKVSTR